jgi:hypothetical protein
VIYLSAGRFSYNNATNNKGYRCYNKRLHKLVDCIDIKVDEEILVKNVRSVEPRTGGIVEDEDE